MLFDESLGRLQDRVAILETVIDILSNILPAPKLHASAEGRGFRYENPDVRHFCLLKAVRVVGALNAAIELARKGYVQELATLMRVVEECRKHIEYVVEVDDGEQHRANVARYFREFFDDTVRDPEADIKGVLIRERIINEQLGKTLDRFAAESGEDVTSRVPAAKLYHRSSRAFSFYVHARYPETMDLYGGRPGRWHLRGMHGTPKDIENLETLDSFVTGASTAFATMIQGLPQLREVVLAVAACAGRDPHPVATVQSQDAHSDCAMIRAEIQANNVRVEELAKENNWKIAQNVATGVVGIVIWPVFFAMDAKGAANTEADALKARQQYLAALAGQRCPRKPSAASAKPVTPPAAN